MHFLILTRRGILLSALAGLVLGISLSLAGLVKLVGMVLLFAALPGFAGLAFWWFRGGKRPSLHLQNCSRIYLYALETCLVAVVAASMSNALRAQSTEGYVQEELLQKLKNFRRLKGIYPSSLDAIEAREAPWSGYAISYKSDGEYFAITYRVPGKEGVVEFNSAAGKWVHFDS